MADDEQQFEVLTAQDYANALAELELTDSQRSMLRAHYQADQHTISVTEMAHAMGWATFHGANLHYGKLAPGVSEALGAKVELFLLALATFDKASPTEHWQLTLRPAVADALELTGLVTPQGLRRVVDEVEPGDDILIEGAIDEIRVNAYERNPVARQLCIDHYGLACHICGFDFEAMYGVAGRGIIHVHHLVPLAELAGEHEVDPIADLRPLCANCHLMVHSRRPALDIEDVRVALAGAQPVAVAE